MPFQEFIRLSPNFGPGPNERLGVLFHHSERSFSDTIELMLRPESQVSYHTLVDLDGTRCVLVPDERIAWHAGASTFACRTRCNDFLVGLAFAGDTYASPITERQLSSALEWLECPVEAQGLEPPVDDYDHRQVAPGRKRDLNPVEWNRLLSAIRGRFGA